MIATTPFSVVEAKLAELLPGFDPLIAEAVLAVVIANSLKGPPIWLMLVAPPSSGKTVILEPMAGIRNGVIVSKLTERTLLSGASGSNGGDPSLLTKLGSRPFLIIKDLGTLLSDPRSRGEIFAQLREVYDGQYVKNFGGHVGRRAWKGKAIVVAAMTPAIDSYRTLDAHLGERFLKLRFGPSNDPVELAVLAWDSTGSERDTTKQLRAAFREVLRQATENLNQVAFSKRTVQRLANLSALLAEVRTPVKRNEYKRDRMELPPTVEGTPRIMKQFGLFTVALCALRGESDLTDFSLLYRLTLDAMPEPRRTLFLAVARAHLSGEAPTVSEIKARVTEEYARQVLEDLVAAGVVQSIERESDQKYGRKPREYSLTKRTLSRLRSSGMIDSYIIECDYVGT